jgi:hypothetical protein
MSPADDKRNAALIELLDAAVELDECFTALEKIEEAGQLTMSELEQRRYGDLQNRVRKLAYRFVRFDTAATLAKFAQPNARGETSIFTIMVGAVITVATGLGECMALADAKLTAGQDAAKVLDGIVGLQRDLCNRASDLLAVDAALSSAESAKPDEPADAEIRKALTDLQAGKGTKKAQAVLSRYAPTGRLGSLKAEDRSKLLADVKRLLTLRLVK